MCMGQLMIEGGNRLQGETSAYGSKNSILPIIAGSILNRSESVIRNVPRLSDVCYMVEIIKRIGAKVKWDDDVLIIDSSGISEHELPNELVRKIRSSIVLLGPMLATIGKVKITGYPGGCEIGPRPIDLHIKSLRKMGYSIDDLQGTVYGEAKNPCGCDIHLDYPSVGATENIMLASVVIKGETVIRNAAKEPEIMDLQNFLNSMGADIKGAGTNTIVVTGVTKLHPVEHTIIPDRIVAGTIMVAAAITKGKITVKNVINEHIQPVIAKLMECGCNIDVYKDWIVVQGNETVKATDRILTLPYPGFPTDMQAQMVSLLSIADGTSVVTETVFENRFKHVQELARMGADITIDGRTAIINGVDSLQGTKVCARDLRGGAAMVLAGLAARGTTIVQNIEYIERGYQDLDKQLIELGADISKIG